MILPFGEYLPDLPDFQNQGATVAKNVVPLISSYGQMKGLNPLSGAIDARARGGISLRDTIGNSQAYVGDATKLYGLEIMDFNDYSKSGGYTTSTDELWEFAKWGNTVIATNFSDDIQVITVGDTTFADLGGTPPKARHINVIRDFVVVGNTYDATDGNVPNRVRWSGINNSETWAVSAATQSDYQDLQGNGGWVQKIVGGEYGVVFQERAIWRMTYIGSPAVFQFDEVEPNRGTPAPNSVTRFGDTIFYLGIDGFYKMENGVRSTPIGTNKVDDTFFADLDETYYDRVSAAVDTTQTLVYWSYAGAGNTDGRPNKLMIYNWTTGKWSTAEIDTEYLFNYSPQGYTLDSLDNVSTSLDDLNHSLDSRAWTGTSSVLGCFNADNKLCDFTGSALDATLETTEAQPVDNARAVITSLRPITDGTATVQLGARENQADSVTWSADTALNSIGEANIRSSSRYHRARVNITGGFNHAQGVEPTIVPQGKR